MARVEPLHQPAPPHGEHEGRDVCHNSREQSPASGLLLWGFWGESSVTWVTFGGPSLRGQQRGCVLPLSLWCIEHGSRLIRTRAAWAFGPFPEVTCRAGAFVHWYPAPGAHQAYPPCSLQLRKHPPAFPKKARDSPACLGFQIIFQKGSEPAV